MATFLDIGFLEKFSVIFPFLLALVVIYGILSYSKLFGDNKTVHILIALFVSMMLLLSDSVRQIINLMAPWFVLLFLFMVFLMIIQCGNIKLTFYKKNISVLHMMFAGLVKAMWVMVSILWRLMLMISFQ